MNQPPRSVFEWIDRIGRPVFIRIMLPCALVWLSWAVVSRILRAMDTAIETGRSIPDMTAGWGPIVIAMGPIVFNIIVDQVTRSRERLRQIDRGVAPGPFDSSPPEGRSGPGSTP